MPYQARIRSKLVNSSQTRSAVALMNAARRMPNGLIAVMSRTPYVTSALRNPLLSVVGVGALALTDAPECSLLVQMPARPRSQGRATSASFDRQT